MTLLRRMHPNARAMNGLASRLAHALARPWQTSYTAPTLRTVDAVLYALRGYDVYWTPVSFDEEDQARNPSSICYRIFRTTHGERVPSHGVELDTIWPRWAILTELAIRNVVARVRARVVIALRRRA